MIGVYRDFSSAIIYHYYSKIAPLSCNTTFFFELQARTINEAWESIMCYYLIEVKSILLNKGIFLSRYFFGPISVHCTLAVLCTTNCTIIDKNNTLQILMFKSCQILTSRQHNQIPYQKYYAKHKIFVLVIWIFHYY